MRKFTATLLVFAVLVAVTHAYADIDKDFEKAAEEWMASRPITLDLYHREKNLTSYYFENVGNVTCFDQFDSNLFSALEEAANQWYDDKTLLGSIVLDLTTAVLPPLLVQARSCANPDIFRKDESTFNAMTTEVLKKNPLMAKTYDDISNEIGYLTKGQIPSNQSCVDSGSDLLEVYRLSSISGFVNQTDGYPFVAKLVYAILPDMIKVAQKCLVGNDEALFNDAFDYWFNNNPDQKAYYEQQDDMVVSLTKILKHDDLCAQRLDKQLQADLQNAYAQFRNGTARIGDLAMRLLHVSLADTVNQARYCLSA